MRVSRPQVIAFLAAMAATSVLGSLFSTQFVIAGLASIDVAVPFGTRVRMSISDLGILPALLGAAAACFVIGFPAAAWCRERFGGSRLAWFALAGGSAIIVELLIIKAVLGVMPVAGARTLAGLACQGVAGAAGGTLYAWLTRYDVAEAGNA